MKKTLAIDFDDVLCDTVRAFLDFNKSRYGVDAVYDKNCAEVLHISDAEELKRWEEFFALPEFCDPKPTEHLAEDLRVLKGEYRLIILTAREKEWKDQVSRWVGKYLPDIFEEIIFIADLENTLKGGLCKHLDIYALVDDDPGQITSCIECGVKVFVFDKPWNREVSRDAIRIKSISEISALL